jgi:hopanoid biosynthesis associated RND transporter like protein HpnN
MRLRKLIARTVLAHPWITLISALLLTLLSVYVTVQRLSFTSTRSALAPLKGRLAQLQEEYRQAFGDRDRAIIVIQSDDQDRAKRFAAALARRLRAQVPGVEEVLERFDLKALEDHFLLYLSPQELVDLKGKLQEHRALLEELSAEPGLNRLFHLIQREISKALVGHLFTGFLEESDGEEQRPVDLAPLVVLLEQLKAWTEGPRVYASPWSRFFTDIDENDDRDGYLWSEDKRFLFVLATVKGDAESFIRFQRPIEGIRKEIRTLQQQYPGIKAGVTGDPALEYDEVNAAQRDSGLATVISLVGVALLVVVVFRGILRPLMGLIALIMGVCWAFGFAAITVGHLNMLSVVLAPMLIGIGMDYGIHLLARYEEERGQGYSIREALERAFEGAGPGILQAAVITSVALFTLLLTKISALRELGFITGSGLLLTLVSTFAVLPPLLLLWDRRKAVVAVVPPSLSLRPPAFLEACYRRPRMVLALSGLATVVALYALTEVGFDGNVLRLQAEGTESVTWELKIIKNSERSTSYGVILARTLEEVREKTLALESLPTISKVESIATVMPEDQERKLPLLRELKPVLEGVSLEVAPPAPVDLEGLLDTLSRIKAKMLTPEEIEKWDRKDTPPLEMMGRVRRLIEEFQMLLARHDPEEVRRRLSTYQGELVHDFHEKVALLARAVASGPVVMEDLPRDLKKQFIGRDGSYLVRVFSRQSPWEVASQAAFVADLRRVDPDAIGDPVEGHEVIATMKRGYQQVGIYALVGVAILILLNFRDLRYFLLAKVPLLVGAVWTAGLMLVFRVKFNLANLIIIPLIVAPGVENGLLIVHRYREEAESAVLPRSIGKGVTLSSLTTMVGFGSLMVAHHRGAFSIGLLVTLGVGSVLAVSLTLLPALLTLAAKRPSGMKEKTGARSEGEFRHDASS